MSDTEDSLNRKLSRSIRQRLEVLISRAKRWVNPPDEQAQQRRRRWLVGLFSLALLFLSILLELNSRGIDLRQALDALGQYAMAVFDRDAEPPNVDPIALLKGLIAVLRNLLPAMLAFWFALWLGENFVNIVYRLSNREAARQYLRDSLFGAVIGPRPHLAKVFTTAGLEAVLGNLIPARPFVIVDKGKILGGEDQPAARIGGPATLVIRNNSAVLLERNGRLKRVLGPGVHRLARFEKVRTIIDLRPRRSQFTVKGMSREGIPVVWTLVINLQIDDSGEKPHKATPENPFPFSDEAVLKATTDQWIRELERDEFTWWDRFMFVEAIPELQRIIARHTLVELLEPTTSLQNFIVTNFSDTELRTACSAVGLDYDDMKRPSDHDTVDEILQRVEHTGTRSVLERNLRSLNPQVDWNPVMVPRKRIRKQLSQELTRRAPAYGAKLLDVALGNVQFDDPVTQQWYENWKRRWDARLRQSLAPARAGRVQIIEQARAEAKRDLIFELTERYRELAARDTVPPGIVVSRFIETLRRFEAHPSTYPVTEYPYQVLRMLGTVAGFGEPAEPPPDNAGNAAEDDHHEGDNDDATE